MATLLPSQFHPAMFKTLYKTATPQTSVQKAEYYQPMIATAVVNGKSMYFVRETHGWFDDAEKGRSRLPRRFSIKRDSNLV